jgi:hypothetical protein
VEVELSTGVAVHIPFSQVNESVGHTGESGSGPLAVCGLLDGDGFG